jgi:gliding motility-associated-like protein
MPAGTYWVTITDFNGCIHSDTTTLTEPTLLTNTLTKGDVVCKGESSGWIKTDAMGGSVPYNYLWSPLFQTTDSIGGLATGFYDVTITDLNGCQVYDTITVNEPDTLVPLITSIQFFGDVNVRCYGDSSATVSVQVTGGTGPYTYSWSNGLTTDTVYNLPAGTVTVFVRDFNGCSIIGGRVLTEPGPFNYSTIISHPKCYGDSSGYVALNVSGSTSPYTYAWSNGASTDSVGNLQSGIVYSIVEDLNNCKDSVGFVLSDPDSMSTPVTTSDYLGYNVSCIGGNDGYIVLNVSGGTGSYTYNWSTASTSDSVFALATGTYNVTVTDSNGCMKDTSIFIDEPTALNLSITADIYSGGFNVRCTGYNDGNAHAMVSGGVAPYSYLWSNADVADSAIGLAAGTYYLTVTDSNGCIITDSITLTEPSTFSLTATLSDFNGYNMPCYGDSAGCVDVVIIGGASPFNYLWDIQDTLDSPMICNLPADTIGLRVQDANGCILDSTFILTEPMPISMTGILSQYNGYNVECFGFNNGDIDLVVGGGVAPFTYLWSTTDTTEDIQNLIAATYQVQVTDTNGCVDTASFTLNEPPQIQNTISTNSSSCGFNNGSAWVQVTAGLTPYSYFWTPTALNTDTINGLAPGWHVVVITDSVGCDRRDSVEVMALPIMVASISSQTNNECFGRSTGSATVSVSGGTAPFTYLWSNGDITDTADSLATGNVSVTITDSSGCTELVSTVITENTQILASVTSTNSSCNGSDNGTASISVTGGVPPLDISWSNGDSGTSADSLGMGYVVYTVIDSNSCVLVDSVNIMQPAPLAAMISAQSTVSCFGGSNGSASVNLPTGGTPPYSFSWSNGDSGPFADSLSAGTISLIITDSNSCVLNLNTSITQPSSALTASTTNTNATCFGYTDGSATVTVSGGTPAYSYLWSPGSATTSSITGLSQGTYTFTVIDSRNCTYTGSVSVAQPTALLTDAGQNITGCEEQYNLNATLGAGYTGTWSISSGSAVFSDQSSPTPTISQLGEGNNIFLWTITDGTCFGVDTLIVHLHEAGECELEMPSAFSPNGDGYNDGFFIRGIDRFSENILTVFNRWGNEVFTKENYKNTQWYGQNKNGDDLPEGTYFVVLIIKGMETKLSTFVDLRRSNGK